MEKWMKGGSPVGINVTRKPIKSSPKKRVNTTKANYKLSKFGKTVAAHRGMPIQMFKDSDGDGVMNALDCEPHNKRKQDVRRPRGRRLSGGTSEMYARKNQYRFMKAYRKQLSEIQKQEYDRLMELRRIQTPASRSSSRSDSTPVILVNGKWEKITSSAGKAQMKKDEAKYNTAMNPPAGSSNPAYQTGTISYSGSVQDPTLTPRPGGGWSRGGGGGSSGGSPAPKAAPKSAISRQASSYKSVAPKLTTRNIAKRTVKRTVSRVRRWFRR